VDSCPPRRILMTGDTVGGVWTFTLDLAAQLGRLGTDVWLAAFGGVASEVQQRQASAIPGLHLFSSALKLEWMDDPWDDVSESCAFLWKLSRDCEPELVHLNSFGHSGLPWSVPVVLTAHSCVASWWAAVEGSCLPPAWRKYRSEVHRALARADVVTAPSHSMLSDLERHYDVELRNRKVIFNGREPTQFRAAEKEPFILSAGRLWDRAKNVHALVDIADRLSWPVFLAGEQRGPSGSAAQVCGCRWLGQLPPDELASWYARASIYAAPARYEPFGLAALEAALSGCALILGDIPSLREIWRDAAVFVSQDDKEQLHIAIEELIQSPRTREEIARRCLRRAKEFTAERMATEYGAAYRLAATGGVACAS
jgi:glycogen synthase